MQDRLDLSIDFKKESERITRFIADSVERRRAAGVVLGLSGGLDSSVAAALCASALSPGRVHVLLLPERDSSSSSVSDAREHAERLGVSYRIEDITRTLEELGCYRDVSSLVARLRGGARAVVKMFPSLARKGFMSNLDGSGGRQFHEFLAFYRIKHRVRMLKIYREAERNNFLAVSCANRTEFETGFFVRYGDDAGDIAPIKHLYKTQVFGMGAFLKIPGRILEKQPSPDLFAGMKDEEIMGVTYDLLDLILDGLSKGMSHEEIERESGIDGHKIRYAARICDLSRSMREPPLSLLENEKTTIR